ARADQVSPSELSTDRLRKGGAATWPRPMPSRPISGSQATVTIFFALIPAYFLSIFYRSCLSVIANPVMTDLGMGPRELGVLGAAWFIAFAASQFPIGWALDRIGPRRTVATCMALGSVGAFLF